MYTPINWHKAHKDKLTRGERAADSMRNRMGSWGFVFGFLIFMAIWAAMNTVAAIKHWDVYPFILLNLFLSMLAGLQGAILLIAAKRADSISAAMAKHDFETNVQSKKEIEDLMKINQRQVDLLEDLLRQIKHKP
ncbi:MAG: DUF1003 domain-containing protein [bacterium]|jgi:uncharacterized membrane protein